MNLQGLSKYCERLNIGGLYKIEYVPVQWVNESAFESILSSSHNFQKDIAFNTGYWLEAHILRNKRLFSEKQRSNKQGDFYRQEITAVVPKLRAEVTGEFLKMKEFTYLLRLTDANGKKWLIGDVESSFRFSYSAVTGGTGGDFNNYQINFQCDTKTPAVGFVPVF